MPKGPEPSGKEAWKRGVGRRPNANAAPSGWRGGGGGCSSSWSPALFRSLHLPTVSTH